MLESKKIGAALAISLGLALGLSAVARFPSSGTRTALDLLWLCVPGAGLFFWSMSRRRAAVAPPGPHLRSILALLSVLAGSLWVAAKWNHPVEVSWALATTSAAIRPTQACWPPPAPTFCAFGDPAWNELRFGVQLHASKDGNPESPWRVRAELPWILKHLGGTLRLAVTQPESAVFEPDGRIAAGDGVELLFLLPRGDRYETLQRVELHPHSRETDRRWVPVDLLLPPDNQGIVIEVLPGPSTSTDWYDRVYVSVTRTSFPLAGLVRLADGVSVGLFVCVVVSGAFIVVRRLRPLRALARLLQPGITGSRVTVLLLPALCLIPVVTLRQARPDFYLQLVAEDSLIENTTSLALFLALPIAWVISKRLLSSNRRGMGILYAVVGLGSLVVVGEEVSWGQRWFSIETPPSIATRNVQHELTFHNLNAIGGLLNVAVILVAAYATFGWLLPITLRGRHRRSLDLLVPPPFLASYFAPALAAYVQLQFDPSAAPFDFAEVAEWLLAWGFLLFVAINCRRIGTLEPRADTT